MSDSRSPMQADVTLSTQQLPPTIPSVALLVPCYNAAEHLPRLADCIHILRRSFSDIICYDDGSTDRTVAVARQLGWRILTPNTNRGVAHARNQLAAAATTEWIHFHDADDRISPHFLERLQPLANDSADVVTCDADWIRAHDGTLEIAWRYNPERYAHGAAAYLLEKPMSLNNSVIRRDAWLRCGGCNESLTMWEDADVHFRLALAGARFRHLPEVLTTALRRPESFSHDHLKSSRCRLAALRSYAAMRETGPLRPLISAQAESLASAALDLGDSEVAAECLRLCRELGFEVPSSRHPVVRAIRAVFPPLLALRLQRLARRRASKGL